MASLADPIVRGQTLRRIASLQVNTPARWGKMSAPQVLCHLNDSYLFALGEKPVTLSTNLFKRTVMKFVALHMPAPWPKNIKTLPEVEQGMGGTPPKHFDRDRNDLVATIERFCASVEVGRHPHPIFGRMSLDEWLRWGFLHADHHLRQFGA